jgi:hypothetical protein
MNEPIEPKPKPKFNLLTRFGFWFALVSAAVWVGGQIINTIQFFLPIACILGIAMMAYGLWYQKRAERELAD